MSNIMETSDNEILFIVKSTPGNRQREPTESDPVVSTLHNRKVYKGDTTILAAEFSAKSSVIIEWKKNDFTIYKESPQYHAGQSILIINNVQHCHHKKKYSVSVTDSKGRRVSSSSKMKVRRDSGSKISSSSSSDSDE
ncbi:uncharacterized protein LOC110981726 [Acanthaster planci]|uniref:Uncharacterized protein LOC110981726 n=1 Tax=Acanthaster planci TaxID=133434 RepID=A0A8B7YPM9_ACAPL|nr:uncharacterized protein LOC110981726 [Acanthaster planci]